MPGLADLHFVALIVTAFLHIVMIFAGLGVVYVVVRIPKDTLQEFVEGMKGEPKNVWIYLIIGYWAGFFARKLFGW